MMSSTHPVERTGPSKATLYCPDCGHASPVDGDWVVSEHDEIADIDCPSCGVTIDSRRTRESSVAESDGALAFVGDD